MASWQRQHRYQHAIFDPRIYVSDIIFTTTPVVGVPLIPFVCFKNYGERPPQAISQKIFEDFQVDMFNRVNNTAVYLSYTWIIVPSDTKKAEKIVEHIENTEEMSGSCSYTPTLDDVGHRVKFFCTIKHDGLTPQSLLIHRSQTITSTPVLHFPPPTNRPMTPAYDFGALGRGSPKFNVLSYNVLHDFYSLSALRAYTPSWVLARTFKRRKQIEELLHIKPDLMCLQEVHVRDFHEIFVPAFADAEYEGIFSVKDFPFVDQWPDGCAIFYQTSKFEVINMKTVHLYRAAEEMLSSETTSIPDMPQFGPVLQIAHLRWKLPGDAFDIILINVHMAGAPSLINRVFGLLALYNMLVTYMEDRSMNIDTTPVIFAGDLNSPQEGLIADFIENGELPIEDKDLISIRTLLRNATHFRHSFENFGMGSGQADSNPPDYVEALYSTASMSQARKTDYIYYRGLSLLPISSYIPDFQNMQTNLSIFRGSPVETIEAAWPNELSTSDHEPVLVQFVVDLVAVQQRDRFRWSQGWPNCRSLADREFAYRLVSNKVSEAVDKYKTKCQIHFIDIIQNFRPLLVKYSIPSYFTAALSEILTNVIFSRIFYEHGYSAETKESPKKKRLGRIQDFEQIRTKVADTIIKVMSRRRLSDLELLFARTVFTNSNQNDSTPGPVGQARRESRSKKLFRCVESWLVEGHNPIRRNAWENFSKLIFHSNLDIFNFPRCRREECEGNYWHRESRNPSEVLDERTDLNLFLTTRIDFYRANHCTFQTLLLDIFHENSEDDSSKPLYAPRRTTVEIITNFLYTELIELYKSYFNGSRQSGIIVLEEAGYADRLKKRAFDSVRKAWLANQIKWYWCQLRSEPYELFERILRLYPVGSTSYLVPIQHRDQQETIRKFFFTNLRFSAPPGPVNVNTRSARLTELACFGLWDPRGKALDSGSAVTRVHGVLDNVVGLKRKLSESNSLLYT